MAIQSLISDSIHPTLPPPISRRRGNVPTRSRLHNVTRDKPVRSVTSFARRIFISTPALAQETGQKKRTPRPLKRVWHPGCCPGFYLRLARAITQATRIFYVVRDLMATRGPRSNRIPEPGSAPLDIQAAPLTRKELFTPAEGAQSLGRARCLRPATTSGGFLMMNRFENG